MQFYICFSILYVFPFIFIFIYGQVQYVWTGSTTGYPLVDSVKLLYTILACVFEFCLNTLCQFRVFYHCLLYKFCIFYHFASYAICFYNINYIYINALYSFIPFPSTFIWAEYSRTYHSHSSRYALLTLRHLCTPYIHHLVVLCHILPIPVNFHCISLLYLPFFSVACIRSSLLCSSRQVYVVSVQNDSSTNTHAWNLF